MTNTIKNQVLHFLKQQKKSSFTMEEISQGIGLTKSQDFTLLVQTIAQMESEKTLEFTKKGKIRLPQYGLVLEGTFRGNERGFGFVALSGETEEVYIPKEHTLFALDGDQVKIDILKPAEAWGDRGAEGRVVEIVERKLTQVVGEFVAYSEAEIAETDLYGYLLPKDKKLNAYKIYLVAEGIRPVDGAICIAEIIHYPEVGYPDSLEGIVTKIIGHKNDPGMDILSIVIQHGIPTEFPDAVLEQANEINEYLSEEDYIGRRDLRDQCIITIDGEDAKDLDDAVTVKKLENGNYFLGVHIADVSYYVKEDTTLDQEAFERGTSVYLTDRVIPMLPHRLSNGICSLHPKVPRLTLSCEMEVDYSGQVVSHEIFPSVIQTTERMTYTAVNKILEEKDSDTLNKYEFLVPMIEEMSELHGMLENMREKRGAISFEDREAKILVNEKGEPQEILQRKRGTGERLIESFMLLANETIAKHFFDMKVPFIYRIHEQPKEEKMQRFFEFASVFGILVKGTSQSIRPKDLQNVLLQIKDRPEEAIINQMLLRSMQQAKYSEDNYGHYGLAAEFYTHFTSPIRRYPDLIVHRLIHTYSSRPVHQKVKDKWQERLPEIADYSSKMERRAVEAERDTDSLKKAEYMLDKIGLEFEGVISSVTKFGFFVELTNTIEGLVHLKTIQHDYFHFVDRHMALVGERTGLVFKVGQKVKVRVTKSDVDTREIDFAYIQSETGKQQVSSSLQNEISYRPRKQKKEQVKSAKSKKKSTYKKPFYKEVAKNKKGKKKNKKNR